LESLGGGNGFGEPSGTKTTVNTEPTEKRPGCQGTREEDVFRDARNKTGGGTRGGGGK